MAFRVDEYGRFRDFGSVSPEEILAMFHPVRCVSCGTIYDAGPVEVVARYADCTRWKQPCCSVIGDDRPVGWGGTVEKINKADYR